ncbi:MAG TPA: hypothetical protein VF008_18770 [Niastella sp.]
MSLTEKLLFLSVGFLVIIFIAIGSLNKSDKLKLLKEKYEAALQGTDKEEAIAAGQVYYRFLRGGELTIEDERTIFKDTAHLPEKEMGNEE